MAEKSTLNFTVFKRLFSYWKSYKRLFAIAILCTVILAIIGPIRPYAIGFMARNYISQGQDAQMLLVWALIIGGLILLEAFFQFVSAYFSNLFAQSIITDVRKSLMKKILGFPMRFFDRTPIGSLVTRVVSDLEAITETFSSGLMSILGDLLSLIFVIGFMFWMDWYLTILTLIPIPILIIATRMFAKFIQGTLKMESSAVTRLNTFVQERLTGMSLVQLFNREKKEYDRFEEINKNHRQAHVNAVWAYSIFFPVVEILSSLSIALVLVWVAMTVKGLSADDIKSQFDEVLVFTLYIHMLYRPIRMMADKFNIIQRGTVRAERVFELIDNEEHIENNGTLTECNFDGKIEFDDIWFAYVDKDWVLKNINLTIDPGQTVAFVGATGAGKSSIVNLLSRFYEYQQGNISIGGTNIRDLELDFLRRNVAIVLQDVFLFSDTVHNNITLGDVSITRERVIEAAKVVGAHDFIVKLPGGYDCEVGERGGVMSVGQRQLLAFIRAYVFNPRILILDEATSSVDNDSEELIQRATEKLTEGRTSIVIAHRLSTIQSADKIVVLEKGEIMEMGDHQELLQHNGYYKTLHDMQFSEQERHERSIKK